MAVAGTVRSACPGFVETMSERGNRPLTIVAVFAGSLAIGLALMMWLLDGPRGAMAPAAIGGPFQLVDQGGTTVTADKLQGKPTLLFFGYTHCPDICPTTLFDVSEVLRAMGKDADRVNAYFVSVVPERESPAIIRDSLSMFHPHLNALPADSSSVAKVDIAHGVYSV